MTHNELWCGIVNLAKEMHLTCSGLARVAGLDSTIFNKSKRVNNNGTLSSANTYHYGYMSGGVQNILYLMAFLSINVGFINLLPIPAFDGGHILFILIELIKGSPVKPEIENKIHTVFLILLMLLMLYITFNDILRLF